MTLQAANHFVIEDNDVKGVVDTQGFSGEPVLDIEFHENTLTGATLLRSNMGLEIDVVVESQPDSHTTYLRLMLPDVNVDAEPVAFAGLAILAKASTSTGGPGLVHGAVQQHEVRPISGTASIVES